MASGAKALLAIVVGHLSVVREHTSRDLRLTAKIPDVFEAKLVFSIGRRARGRKPSSSVF
jgi:hypothetical protein